MPHQALSPEVYCMYQAPSVPRRQSTAHEPSQRLSCAVLYLTVRYSLNLMYHAGQVLELVELRLQLRSLSQGTPRSLEQDRVQSARAKGLTSAVPCPVTVKQAKARNGTSPDRGPMMFAVCFPAIDGLPFPSALFLPTSTASLYLDLTPVCVNNLP